MPDTSAVTVLLVEDDEVIRRSVALALERYGYRVTTAADGLDGQVGTTVPTCCFST